MSVLFDYFFSFNFFMIYSFPKKFNHRTPAFTCAMPTIETSQSKICSELTIKTPELRNWRYLGVSSVNFKKISHIEQVNTGWSVCGKLLFT